MHPPPEAPPAPARIGIIGCGALAEQYYAPALRALTHARQLEVTALMDPDHRRRDLLLGFFPQAYDGDRLDAITGRIDLAIVCSPPRCHAEQTIRLLVQGIAVLCEKPMATTGPDGEAMIAAARTAGRPLAVGLFRRFFPALETIRSFTANQTYGHLRSFDIQEGGPFNWPAATPSFFDPALAGGGVLLDAGIHVLDILHWWLGEPSSLVYADDARGGLEANARLNLRYARPAGSPTPAAGTVLLSRDWKTANAWTLDFERATVRWRVGQADRLEIKPAGSPYWLVSQLAAKDSGQLRPADSYAQAFTRQIVDVVAAVREGRPPRVSGEDALASLRLIERCYRERTPLPAA